MRIADRHRNQLGKGLLLLLAWMALGASTATVMGRTHVVRRGESLSTIAARHGVTVGELLEANSLKSKNLILAGQKLVIPEAKDDTGSVTPLSPPRTHTVRKGETLSDIAARNGVSIEELVQWNSLARAGRIYPGQELFVSKPPATNVSALLSKDRGEERIHVVQKNETLSRIAHSYGLGLKDLAGHNGIRKPYPIRMGQKLKIPAGGGRASTRQPKETIRIMVRKQETLAEIADRYGVSVKDLARYNAISDPDKIYPGQRLLIPGVGASKRIPINPELQNLLGKIGVRGGRWKYIVLHHSATDMGDPKGMDAYHRRRGMENGLAYHFVIGNGRKMGDGAIYVGNRWRKQINGGHLAKESLNAKSIGICLVGDFQKYPPSSRQMRALNGLVDYLLSQSRLKPEAVQTHRQIHPNHTACPGRKFPASSFISELKKRY